MNPSSLEELASRKSAERKGVPAMLPVQAEPFLKVLRGWKLVDNSVEKEFQFKSYHDGLEFAYAVGRIAEQQDHHPDILIRWKMVKLTLSTHSVKGVSENDFIVAANAELKFNELTAGISRIS